MVLPNFNGLLEKEMNRKEFLTHLGLGILAIVGITSVLQRLNGDDHKPVSRSTGSSAYGGGRKSSNIK